MNDPATVGAILNQAGFNAQALLALTSDQDTKDTLKAATQLAIERGVFGEPIKADAALAMGLVNRVVLSTEVNALARTQARQLVSKPMS